MSRITHNFLGTVAAFRTFPTQKGTFARFKIQRRTEKPARHAKIRGKALDTYTYNLENGVFENQTLDFGGYFAKETYKDKDGVSRQGSVFVVLSVQVAKTPEQIKALRAAKLARMATGENVDHGVQQDQVSF